VCTSLPVAGHCANAEQAQSDHETAYDPSQSCSTRDELWREWKWAFAGFAVVENIRSRRGQLLAWLREEDFLSHFAFGRPNWDRFLRICRLGTRGRL
jgi:hypothetical protein